jgi:uncharacterized protein
VAVSAFANLVGHARAGKVKWNCAIVFALAGVGGAIRLLVRQGDRQKLLGLFGAVRSP